MVNCGECNTHAEKVAYHVIYGFRECVMAGIIGVYWCLPLEIGREEEIDRERKTEQKNERHLTRSPLSPCHAGTVIHPITCDTAIPPHSSRPGVVDGGTCLGAHFH